MAIALAALAFGLLCGRRGLSSWDEGYGYERYASLVLLLLAGASFVVAAVALTFARSRKLFWLGVLVLVVLYGVTNQHNKLRTAAAQPQTVSTGGHVPLAIIPRLAPVPPASSAA